MIFIKKNPYIIELKNLAFNRKQVHYFHFEKFHTEFVKEQLGKFFITNSCNKSTLIEKICLKHIYNW